MFQRAVFCNPVKGGETVTVSGVVTSAEDKQPLIGVNVISGSATGVSTLADGSYSIEVAPAPHSSSSTSATSRSSTSFPKDKHT